MGVEDEVTRSTSETIDGVPSTEVSAEEVIEHVVRMRVPANDSQAKCVDGGYKENESVGAIAFPGADLGTSMILLAKGYTPDQAFQLVYKFCVSEGRKYSWHTDQHEGHHDTEVGCGHCNAAILNPHGLAQYGLEPDKVRELLTIVKAAQSEDQSDSMECVQLDREHTEKGILVVVSKDFTVKPWDQEKDQQFFIYDKTRHEEMLTRLVAQLNPDDSELTAESLIAAAGKHTSATLGLLGSSKGKPMFKVDVGSETPIVQKVGNAPDHTS